MIDLVIIDSTLISDSTGSDLEGIKALLNRVSAIGIKIALVSTDNAGLNRALNKSEGLTYNYTLSGEEVYKKPKNKFKGGAERITSIARELGAHPYSTLYLGDDRFDYASAVHAGAIFILVTWNKGNPDNINCLYANAPKDVWRFVTHYLLHEPRWSFSIDLPNEKFSYRGLLSSNTKSGEIILPGNLPHSQYNLIELLKENNGAYCGHYSSAAILFLHALTSAKIEGLIPEHAVSTVYPSSTPGQSNPVVSEMSELASRLIPSHFYNDIIVRAVQAPKSRENKIRKLDSYLVQTNTVHLNPIRQQSIEGRTVVVFDDFHTTGKSMDWARNLLTAAGASAVIGITLGKFGTTNFPHEFYRPKQGVIISPYSLKSYTLDNFNKEEYTPNYTSRHESVILKSFAKLMEDEPYK